MRTRFHFNRFGFGRSLFPAGATDVDVSRTALHSAAWMGSVDAVKQLLAAGAAAGAQDQGGRTPLHDAALSAHPEVLQLLLSAGASVDQQDSAGRTALHDAANASFQFASTAADACIKLLLAAGADVNACSEFGWTALHFAAGKGRATAVSLLVSAGADVAAVNSCGQTALHVAVECTRAAAVAALLSAGAAVDAASSVGVMPLSAAAVAAVTSWNPYALDVLEAFTQHSSKTPLAVDALLQAAAAAAKAGAPSHLYQQHYIPVVRLLLSAVATAQPDAGEVHAALQRCWPARRCATALLTGTLLQLWLAAADDEVKLVAGLPALQQMIVGVAGEQIKASAAARQCTAHSAAGSHAPCCDARVARCVIQ